MGIIKKNERFRKLFSEYLTATNKPTTTTYGGYCGYNHQYPASVPSAQTSNVHIYFYEWSNMLNGAKVMNSKKELFERCEKDKIYIPNEAKRIIDTSDWIWCTCVPGKAELMVATQYYDLSTKLSTARKAYEKELEEKKILALPSPSEMGNKWEAAKKAYEESNKVASPCPSEIYY